MNKLPMYCLGALLALLCGCAASTKDTIVLTQPVSDARAAISDAMGEDSQAADCGPSATKRMNLLRRKSYGGPCKTTSAP